MEQGCAGIGPISGIEIGGIRMENSILWSKSFIPVYFVVALLNFLLFNYYIQANILSTLLIILPVTGVGIASIIYNSKRK